MEAYNRRLASFLWIFCTQSLRKVKQIADAFIDGLGLPSHEKTLLTSLFSNLN